MIKKQDLESILEYLEDEKDSTQEHKRVVIMLLKNEKLFERGALIDVNQDKIDRLQAQIEDIERLINIVKAEIDNAE